MTGWQLLLQRRQDLRLVARIKAGDQQAFRSLVERYQARIYALVRAMVGSHALSDDITQDTFIKVYRNLSSFDESYPFFPWLRRIAVNTALTALQVQRTQNRVALDEDLAEEASLDQAIERNELIVQMQKEIARLPEEQRTVFVLRTQQEMSYDEIAAALDLSVGTVMSRLSRARSRLKESLHEYI